jgi:hypothetical protein
VIGQAAPRIAPQRTIVTAAKPGFLRIAAFGTNNPYQIWLLANNVISKRNANRPARHQSEDAIRRPIPM